MFKRLFCLTFMAISAAFISPAHAAYGSCPVYTHKDDVLETPASTLPEGWFVYRIITDRGLYISSLKSYTKTMIPNTDSVRPTSIEISDDGKWIVFVDAPTYKTYIIRPDGTGKTLLDLPSCETGYPSIVGFYHGSPKGSELYYVSGVPTVHAIAINLTGATPVLGTARLIANFYILGRNKTPPVWDARIEGTLGAQFAVVKDQIYGMIWISKSPGVQFPTISRSSYATIPNGGNGTAVVADINTWLNDPYLTTYGCGQAMSWDGSLCVANSALIGDSCVPSKMGSDIDSAGIRHDSLDHKGFYINKFIRTAAPKIPINDQILNPSYGVSINWCPKRFRKGDYASVDWNHWKFANTNQYVIGAVRGTPVTPVQGLYVVDWAASKWTLVTPDQKVIAYDFAAMYVTGPGSGVRMPRNADGALAATAVKHALMMGAQIVAMPAGSRGFTLHTLTGRQIWSYSQQPGSGARSVQLPRTMGVDKSLVVRYK